MQKNMCSCLALYGKDGSNTDIKGWLEFILNFLEKINCIPNKISIGGGKPLSLEAGLTKLKKLKFNAHSIETFCAPLVHTSVLSAWRVYAALNVNTKTSVMCFDNSTRSIDEENVLDILKQQLKVFNYEYGIIYDRPFDKGPELYAYGMTAGLGYTDEDMKEKIKISSWFHLCVENGYFANGTLRDIYRYNILSNEYLLNKPKTTTLCELIESVSTKTTLSQLSDRLWIWSIDPKAMAYVRELLEKTGFISN